MNNIPLTNMAVSLSGGGYRATTFHLGALSLLDMIELEAGNRLICDEQRREKGASLLENVRIISTISGGTLTGIMYALKLSQKGNFKDCYYKLYDLLEEDILVDRALDKLNSPDSWKNKHKSRNAINSFSEIYNELFYDEATFGDLYKDLDSHLTDAIFGASEFTSGLQYRFQESGRGYFGSGDLYLPKEVAGRIRLADAAAASSCFPGGFEPMTMPTDFSNGPETRVEEWWAKKKINFEREATLALAQSEAAAAEAEAAAKQAPELAASIAVVLKTAAKASQIAERDVAKVKEAIEKVALAQSEAAAAEAAEAIKRVPELATSIEVVLKTAAKASKKAGRDAAQVKKAIEDFLKDTAVFAEAAQTKTEEAANEVKKAKAASKASAAAAQKATEEVAAISQQDTVLAGLLLKAMKAATHASEAVAAAEEATKKAEKRVRKANKEAQEADLKAQKDLQNAHAESEAIAQARDMTAALKKAERAATQAEKSSVAAKEAATVASEASADLALIFAEKVVESTALAQKVATTALNAAEKGSLLDEALSAALKAEAEAIASVAVAKDAVNVVDKASGQLETCTKAVALAENASTEVASYTLTEDGAPASLTSTKGMVKSRGIKATAKVIDLQAGTISKAEEANLKSKEEAAAATAARKTTAVSAAEAVAADTAATVKAAKAAALAVKSPGLTNAITILVTAATKAATSAQVAEEKSVLARNEKPHHPTTAIMDGGILDNQGIRGVVMAEKRYSSNGTNPFIGTYIISDVSGKTMAPYTVPTFSSSSFKNFFTLKTINIIATVLLLGIVGLLVFVETATWGVIVATFFLTILILWFVVYLGIRSLFRAKVSATFAGDELPEIMKDLKVLVNTPLYIIMHLLMFRATSALKMITDVFLRRIRRLQIHGLYKSTKWNYRIVGNNIYGLKDADKLTPALKKVINAANNMPTTLWFSQVEKEEGALNDLIACGQLTLCSNLANYLRGLKKGRNKETVWEEIEEYHHEIDAVLEVVEHYWQNFRVNPYWMINEYKAERAQHEAERKKRQLQ